MARREPVDRAAGLIAEQAVERVCERPGRSHRAGACRRGAARATRRAARAEIRRSGRGSTRHACAAKAARWRSAMALSRQGRIARPWRRTASSRPASIAAWSGRGSGAVASLIAPRRRPLVALIAPVAGSKRTSLHCSIWSANSVSTSLEVDRGGGQDARARGGSGDLGHGEPFGAGEGRGGVEPEAAPADRLPLFARSNRGGATGGRERRGRSALRREVMRAELVPLVHLGPLAAQPSALPPSALRRIGRSASGGAAPRGPDRCRPVRAR